MAGKRYYSYGGHSGHRRAPGTSDSLFGWTIFMFLLIGFVFLCWMGSYYVFAHPESASNYRLLKRLHKIESPQRFEITAAPRGEFLKPGKLLEHFGSMSPSEINRSNETLLRNFIRNYHQNRDLVPYAVGTYRVIGIVPLTSGSFCQPGLVALLQAVEQPEVLLEQVFTADEKNLPALKRALPNGQEIKLEKPLDLSAVIHVERLSDNRIKLTTMPLLYGSYGAGQGPASFSLEPPPDINIESGLPVLTAEQTDQLCGGLPRGSRNAKDQKNAAHLSRIPEEAATPTPEPRVKKALPATAEKQADQNRPTASEPMVARAIPVNVTPVLPAIPVSTPPTQPSPTSQQSVTPPAPATPLTPPVIPNTPATAMASNALLNPTATPATTPIPKPTTFPAPIPVTPSNSAVGLPSPAPAASTAPSEVWPVYAPGQMPRGRLVQSGDSEEMLSRGIGGERHYLQGRFAVTASGNGRVVLRPQGAIAGVPMGPSSRVRIIVDFPAGAINPSEGAVISRDSMRPFQIVSVKRGDDGQINVYAREVTRGQ